MIRLAESKDIAQLVRMRWDFTIKHHTSKRFNESDRKKLSIEVPKLFRKCNQK
ncbi:hypothetical protein [Peribacillus loiseleuriae]|uniref:hypothetical protein n=1 Tax=Peribacillus loiseleuriae TaxID=1679170 RepID=UPI001FDEE023|nr:hypothetical protein [Peribacillus loiseleuriae]